MRTRRFDWVTRRRHSCTGVPGEAPKTSIRSGRWPSRSITCLTRSRCGSRSDVDAMKTRSGRSHHASRRVVRAGASNSIPGRSSSASAETVAGEGHVGPTLECSVKQFCARDEEGPRGATGGRPAGHELRQGSASVAETPSSQSDAVSRSHRRVCGVGSEARSRDRLPPWATL